MAFFAWMSQTFDETDSNIYNKLQWCATYIFIRTHTKLFRKPRRQGFLNSVSEIRARIYYLSLTLSKIDQFFQMPNGCFRIDEQ